MPSTKTHPQDQDKYFFFKSIAILTEMRRSESSRESNAKAAICETAYFKDCGEDRISEFIHVRKEIIEQSHLKYYALDRFLYGVEMS
jgi:hypothetical protein